MKQSGHRTLMSFLHLVISEKSVDGSSASSFCTHRSSSIHSAILIPYHRLTELSYRCEGTLSHYVVLLPRHSETMTDKEQPSPTNPPDAPHHGDGVDTANVQVDAQSDRHATELSWQCFASKVTNFQLPHLHLTCTRKLQSLGYLMALFAWSYV